MDVPVRQPFDRAEAGLVAALNELGMCLPVAVVSDGVGAPRSPLGCVASAIGDATHALRAVQQARRQLLRVESQDAASG